MAHLSNLWADLSISQINDPRFSLLMMGLGMFLIISLSLTLKITYTAIDGIVRNITLLRYKIKKVKMGRALRLASEGDILIINVGGGRLGLREIVKNKEGELYATCPERAGIRRIENKDILVYLPVASGFCLEESHCRKIWRKTGKAFDVMCPQLVYLAEGGGDPPPKREERKGLRIV